MVDLSDMTDKEKVLLSVALRNYDMMYTGSHLRDYMISPEFVSSIDDLGGELGRVGDLKILAIVNFNRDSGLVAYALEDSYGNIAIVSLGTENFTATPAHFVGLNPEARDQSDTFYSLVNGISYQERSLIGFYDRVKELYGKANTKFYGFGYSKGGLSIQRLFCNRSNDFESITCTNAPSIKFTNDEQVVFEENIDKVTYNIIAGDFVYAFGDEESMGIMVRARVVNYIKPKRSAEDVKKLGLKGADILHSIENATFDSQGNFVMADSNDLNIARQSIFLKLAEKVRQIKSKLNKNKKKLLNWYHSKTPWYKEFEDEFSDEHYKTLYGEQFKRYREAEARKYIVPPNITDPKILRLIINRRKMLSLTSGKKWDEMTPVKVLEKREDGYVVYPGNSADMNLKPRCGIKSLEEMELRANGYGYLTTRNNRMNIIEAHEQITGRSR